MKDYTTHPLLNRHKPEQGEKRQFKWKILLVIPVFIAAGFFQPQINKLLSDLASVDPIKLVTMLFEKDETPEAPHIVDFDKVLAHALRSAHQGDREKADQAFRDLLRRVSYYPSHDERTAALFARAADFYSNGSEYSTDDVDRLYLLALEAIQQVHGEGYHELENVYAGLEAFYLLQGRYDEAVTQTRSLLDFYQRYRKDAQLERVGPVTIRLGHSLMKAGHNLEARDVYRDAAVLWRSAGQQNQEIKSFIDATYLAGEARPDVNGNFRSTVEAVHIDGIVVEQIDEDEERITIVGYADDNKRIADYLRLLKSQVSRPDLNLVASGSRQKKAVSEFSISIKKR